MQNMTTGPIAWAIIQFAIPMVLGNLLQLTYNAVDSVIIGKNLGETALAAVATSNPIMTIMILGASGVGIGASVIMSRFYGAKDLEKLKREFSTTLLLGGIISFATFLLGFLFAERILLIINTPAEALSEAHSYLQIVLFGFLFTFQYNILSNALRAIGDSKVPVYILAVSCLLNIILDYVFVALFPLGVFGAGLATLISQALSVILSLFHIYRDVPALALKPKDICLDKGLLWLTIKTGSLTALQQAAQPIGKVFIQSVINAQGVTAIGAFNAVCRIDDFAYIPTQSIGSAIMTCAAQNLGAGNGARVKESLRKGLLVSLAYFPMLFAVVQLGKTAAVSLLIPDDSPEMLQMGVAYLSLMAFFFLSPCITNAFQGYFRGLGHMGIVFLGTCIQIGLRAVFVFLLVPKLGIIGEAWSCLIGWGTMILFILWNYRRFRREGLEKVH